MQLEMGGFFYFYFLKCYNVRNCGVLLRGGYKVERANKNSKESNKFKGKIK
jgi:hypothetical protein